MSGQEVQAHAAQGPGASSRRHVTIALVGNPNTGKTTLFNALTGLRQRVGNYPGVTVEIKKGRRRVGDVLLDIFDLPGTYSLSPRTPDEMLAVDLLLGRRPGDSPPDVILAIVDASNLERNLYLTTQLMELGRPLVVALNMMDLAEKQGISIDIDRLRNLLGVPVVPIQAHRGIGLDRLEETLVNAAQLPAPRAIAFPRPFEEACLQILREHDGTHLPRGCPDQFLARRLILDVGGSLEKEWVARDSQAQHVLDALRKHLEQQGLALSALEPRVRYGWIRELARACLSRGPSTGNNWTDRLDRILTHRWWGTLLFLAVMFLVFQAIFTGAEPLMEAIDWTIGTCAGALHKVLPPGPVRSLVCDGILQGVGSVLAFVPQIMILFAFIAVLEDCGYMARAAFLMDRLMARFGLSGKSFIPLLSSFACAIPGIMATRVIDDRRDRLATILIAPLMSCSARLPVYTLLIAAFVPTDTWLGSRLQGLVLFAMYMLGIVVAPVVAWCLKRTLLRGEPSLFLLELPPYKWPSARLVVFRMLDRAWAFVHRAGTLILATMVLVWALLYFPVTDASGQRYDAVLQALEERLQRATGDNLPDANESSGSGQAATKPSREESVRAEIAHVRGAWRRQSYLGRLGHALEPVVRPLGWDWRIAMATLASFPAREIVVGTLSIVYDVDTDLAGEEADITLRQRLRQATWDSDPSRPVFTLPVALSLMVFFALCCQCVSTLAVIRRETNTWTWPLFTFVYMTLLAYLGALVTYQVGTLLG